MVCERRCPAGRLPACLLALLVTVTVPGCTPPPVADDEGDATFAGSLFPHLLGRRAHGVDEVEVVADISQLLGRDVAVRMLMEDPAYVDHWTDVLVDLIQLQRSAFGPLTAQDKTCWGDPTRPDPDPAIAHWVRDHGPLDAGAPTPAWNMTDLVRSAVAADDLSPLFRAHLFTLWMRRGDKKKPSTSETEAQIGRRERRGELADHFLRTYLNRNVPCLSCHSEPYSASNKTDANDHIVWRRLWSIPGNAERALFGNYYETSTLSRVRLVMRGDVRTPSDNPVGARPWNMGEECAQDLDESQAATLTHRGFQPLPPTATGYTSARFGSLDGSKNPRVSLWELEAALRQGISDLRTGYKRFQPSSPILPPAEQLYCDVVGVFSKSCQGGCHPPSAKLDLLGDDPAGQLVGQPTQGPQPTQGLRLPTRVVAGDPSSSELWRRINLPKNDPDVMPPGGQVQDKTLIFDWIQGGAVSTTTTSSCNTSHEYDYDVKPDEAFAFLTAANFVDGVWMSVMGHRLTIDHGFPRNQAQRDMLWTLTELHFLPQGWSLRAVLTTILTSDWFARRAPVISQAATAYELPPVLDPWVVADPSEVPNPSPHQRANGQGELVERHLVQSVLGTLAATLGWKEPRRFPGGGYPSPLDENLGQFLSAQSPGFNGVSFQSLLALESEVGLCQPTGRQVGTSDWIDALVTEVAAFNVAHPHAPLTVGDLWLTLKDRMIQDPTIETDLPSELVGIAGAKTEEEALVAFWNQGVSISGSVGLHTPATAFTTAELEDKLREGCGILVKSPEFLLSMITPRGYSDNNMPDPPRLSVCLEGEACGYQDTCAAWRSRLLSIGKAIACEDRSVRRHQSGGGPPFTDPSTAAGWMERRVATLCPEGSCGFLKRPDPIPCIRTGDAESCFGFFPWCDPRTDCGSPTDFRDPGVHVVWAEGGLVREAEGVSIRGANEDGWRALSPETQLQAGDLLVVPLSATLRVEAGDVEFGAIGANVRPIEGVWRHLIAVSGPSAESVLDAAVTGEGVIGPIALRRAVTSGQIESRPFTEEIRERVIRYGARPESRYVLSAEEIAAINEDFDSLHFPPGLGLTPDGRALPDDAMFSDGFESGDTSAWSQTVP